MTDLRDTSPPPAYTEEDVAVLFEPHTQLRSSDAGGDVGVGFSGAGRRLVRPVALPQTGGAYDAPFVRAWAPALAGKGITMEDWLGFVEGLNVAM